MYGVALMLGYLGFDGFTSTFQARRVRSAWLTRSSFSLYFFGAQLGTSLRSVMLRARGSRVTPFRHWRRRDCLFVEHPVHTRRTYDSDIGVWREALIADERRHDRGVHVLDNGQTLFGGVRESRVGRV